MQRTAAAFVALLFIPALVTAQVRPEPRTDAVTPRPASGNVTDKCELSVGESLVMSFDSCSRPGAGVQKEIEVVEYRNGDSRSRVGRVTVGGRDMDREDVAVVRLAWEDYDDDGRTDLARDFDGDGKTDFMAEPTRMRPGKVKVGRVTLKRMHDSGAKNARADWPPPDVDEDGYPVTVEVRDSSAGSTTIAFDRCRTMAGAEPRETGNTLTLVCRDVRMVAALDANPYARFVSHASNPSSVAGTTVHRQPPSITTRSAANARVRMGAQTTRLDAARLESWSVHFDSAAGGAGRWALRVRTGREP